MNTVKQIITITIFIVLGFFAAWYMYSYAQQFSAFGITLILMALSCTILWAIDKFLLVSYDILEELKKGNIAVAIALCAYSYLLGQCIIAAFTVFK
jgi:hypothetical protein